MLMAHKLSKFAKVVLSPASRSKFFKSDYAICIFYHSFITIVVDLSDFQILQLGRKPLTFACPTGKEEILMTFKL